MTRKEQIKAILDEYAIFKGYYVKGGVGAERIYSGELADRIAALPLDVPGDEEIDTMRFAVFDDVINDIEEAERSGYIKGYKNGKKAMRSEILKRNTP